MKRNSVIMGIISTILSVFGCSPNGKKNGEKITQSIEEFNNRKIYSKLTEELIDNTSDDKLLQLVFDNLPQKSSKDYENEFETVMSWNKSKQAIYMIWALESEVNNGGYNQFYFNSSGQFYKYLPDALKLVGAHKFSDLTKQANITFEKENAKIKQYQDGTIDGFSKSYEDNPLNKFDDDFYDLYKTENLEQIQVDFIRKHKTEFIDN
ncbi:DMP19 family protein [Flavobacterium sp. XS1P32]|uniref:DMP19 family protein n=1 Tax=unclassified Flavobacterium TaxID=196869 RepID=UPI003AAE50ED